MTGPFGNFVPDDDEVESPAPKTPAMNPLGNVQSGIPLTPSQPNRPAVAGVAPADSPVSPKPTGQPVLPGTKAGNTPLRDAESGKFVSRHTPHKNSSGKFKTDAPPIPKKK